MKVFEHDNVCWICYDDYIEDKFIKCDKCTATLCIECYNKNDKSVCPYGHTDKYCKINKLGLILQIVLFSIGFVVICYICTSIINSKNKLISNVQSFRPTPSGTENDNYYDIINSLRQYHDELDNDSHSPKNIEYHRLLAYVSYIDLLVRLQYSESDYESECYNIKDNKYSDYHDYIKHNHIDYDTYVTCIDLYIHKNYISRK